jgi:two-component system chemotaxis response regulator CheB
MGRDGADGLREVRERGGHTIAQDEATSVIFGMPREAAQSGAAAEILAIEQIAPALIRWVESC